MHEATTATDKKMSFCFTKIPGYSQISTRNKDRQSVAWEKGLELDAADLPLYCRMSRKMSPN